MLLPHGTTIALVDGRQFALYRNAGNTTEPSLESLPSPELEPHNKGSGAHHQTTAANPSGNLLDEDAHAAAVADWLNHQVLTHKIEQLIIIAAPRTLGELRRHYHKQLEQVLVAELDKDLLSRPPADVLAALRDRK